MEKPKDLGNGSIAKSGEFKVSGRVSSPGGAPTSALKIVVVDKDLRTEQELGSTETDAEGAYSVVYSSKAASSAEQGAADLVVRAFDTNGALLLESPVRFNADADERIDLVVPVAPVSEWMHLVTVVGSMLEGQGVMPNQFTEADIAFIVADGSVNRDWLLAWVWSYEAALSTPLADSKKPPRVVAAPSAGSSGSSMFDWAFYYACAREDLPRSIPELFGHSTEDLLAVVRRAVSLNRIPDGILKILEQLKGAIDRLRTDLQLKPAAANQPASLGDLLNTVSADWLDTDQRRSVVALVANVDPDAPDFAKHAAGYGLDEKDAFQLQRTLRVSRLAEGHLPAVAALQPALAESQDGSIAALAKLDSTQWVDAAYRGGAPGAFASSPEVFGLRMRDALERAEPEVSLQASLDAKSLELTGRGFESIGRFLSNNAHFRFAHDDVDEFVANADLGGIEEPVEDVAAALRQMQSLHGAGVRWQEAPAFIDAGITSVEALAEYGANGLKKVVGGQVDEQRTLEIATAARLMKTAGLGLVGQLLPLMRGSSAAVMQPRVLNAAAQKIVDSSPSLRRLFGVLEQCACDPCQSVLSPSAYLVDLLNFISRDSDLAWTLQSRRADLYDLELSCDNAQIELPHIDLVNEILENAVALPYAVSLPGVADVAAALKQHPYPAALVLALQDTSWEPVVESLLWAEVSPSTQMGTTTAVVADRSRRWGIDIRAGYFGITGRDRKEKFDLSEAEMSQLIAALDQGTLPGLDPDRYLGAQVFGGGKLPRGLSDVVIEALEPGRRWRITLTTKGTVEIDDKDGKIRYSAAKNELTRAYSSEALRGTRQSLESKRFGGVLLAEVLDAGNYLIEASGKNAWAYGKTVTYDFVYVPAGIVIRSLSYQCTARDRDLWVRPQNRNPRAYRDFLGRADAVYPWTLPFDVDLAETRAVLTAAGIDRASLMAAALPPADESRRGSLAIERLGMLRSELVLATTAAPDADVWKRWGLKVTGNSATIRDSFDDKDKTDTPLTLLSTVSILLQQSRLTFVDLRGLLQSQFINPGLTASIKTRDGAAPDSECDPTQMEVYQASAALLDRLHRFVRWQRRLKWTVPELDFALRVLTGLQGTTADRLADQLADLEALRSRLGVSIESLLTAFYGFDRTSYTEQKDGASRVIEPLYERVFQNPRTAQAGGAGVTRVPDPALAFAALSNPASTITVGDYAGKIAACVGLPAHAVLPLINADYALATPPVAAVSASTRVTVEHLRVLFRNATLSRALRVSPARLAALMDLRSQSIHGSPRALLQFCDDVAFIANSGFDVDQLRYILTHRGPESFAWVMTPESGVRTLQALQVALRSADAQTSADAPDVAMITQRRAAVIIANLAQAFSVDAALVTPLLARHLRGTGNAAAIDLFADPKLGAADQRFDSPTRVFEPSTVTQTAEFAVLLKLHKFSLLNAVWRVSQADLLRFPGTLPDSSPLLGLDLNALPVVPTSGRFTDWKRSTTLLTLSRAAAGLATVLDDYTTAISAAGADPIAAGAAVWATALELPPESVAGFAGAGLLDFNAGNSALQSLRDPLRIDSWYRLMLLARQFAFSANDLKQVITESPGKVAIDIAVQALRARFGDPQWRDVLVKSTNALRTQQRDRLVDYLVWRDGLRDAEALYERYLIDVQMAPCMNTTRVLQATSAVQLFVQRCLMNLEAGIRPATVDPDGEWEWRKNYRVWEANRKVFLYPENWLYPELRDDKSEIYRSFESTLMSSEASDANARIAVKGYLEALLDVSQISVMGMYEEAPRSGMSGLAQSAHKTLHVVGRSPDPPYAYYYRTNQQNGEAGSRWTAWERISLDLPDCHIVPFMLGGELHLVWPVVELQQDSQGQEYYNVRLAWSRRTSLGWTQRKVATETATRITKYVNRDSRGALALKLSESSSDGARRAQVELYVARKTPSQYAESSLSANIARGEYTSGTRSNTGYSAEYANWTFAARAYLKYQDTGRIVMLSGAQFFVLGMKPAVGLFEGWYLSGVYGGSTPDQVPAANAPGYAADGTAYELPLHNESYYMMLKGVASIGGVSQSVISDVYITPYMSGTRGSGSLSANLLFTAATDPDFGDPAVDPSAGVRMALQGRFIFESGRDTRWAVDGNATMLPMPAEAFAWESRWRERVSGTPQLNSGLRTLTSQPVFSKSRSSSNYVSLNASRVPGSGAQTWYWEESAAGDTNRFFRTLNAANPTALIGAQPSSFEDAREYLYRYAQGPEQLFLPEVQDAPTNRRFGVDALPTYFPGGLPSGIDPRYVPLLQFHLGMPYGAYNWEVFYHVPMAVARFLTSQQRYEEAQRWLACVFDPTSNDSESGRERYWRCLPLRHSNAPASIQQLMQALANPNSDPTLRQSVQDQVAAWEANPFSPFAVARSRNSSYEWYAVTAYVENLIAWGDSLFRQDTRESINEAAMLYVFAGKILGRKPEVIPKQSVASIPMSYRALAGRWDDFSNAWVRLVDTPLGRLLLEWLLALQKLGGINPHAYDKQIEQLVSVGSMYFCIPRNDKQVTLVDTVADRLWKIRHCRNIDGAERPLALLDPPIDPELLIRARLAGVDVTDVLADLHAPPPTYRYTVLVQKALEFCSELKALGGALLSAIEKKDIEKLSLLRSTQEITMLKLVEAVKRDQVSETEANIQALKRSRENAVARFRFLQRMLGNTDITFDAQDVPVLSQIGTLQVYDANAPGDFRGLGLVQSEVDQVLHMQDAHIASTVAGALRAAAAIGRTGAAVLQSYPVTALAGQAAYSIAEGLTDLSEVSAVIAGDADQLSHRSGLIASFQRRREEWIQQSSVAVDEVRQIDKQIVSATLRKAIAEKDLENHRRGIDHAREIDDYLRQRKFSNAELYSWIETQLLATYHGAYQLAFDLAKRAERAWRRDLGETTSQWIRFGYWDGARKGLQAGEQLHLDLNRMQLAYLDRSTREYEITKHVSLLSLDPAALVSLRELGNCRISIPEAVFDLDFPGHYFRRLKAVSVSIPCVVGPYGGVPATLRLVKSSLRNSSRVTEGYARIDDDTRFTDTLVGGEAVVTSSGQNDSGLFETGLRDERYLPFEGSGAVSTWQLELPDEFRGFDYASIADVVLHVRYTARDGGSELKDAAKDSLRQALNAVQRMQGSDGLARMFSLRQDFPAEWYRLTHPSNALVASAVSIGIAKSSFPLLFAGAGVRITITGVEMYAVPAGGAENYRFPGFVGVYAPNSADALAWSEDRAIGELPGKSAEVAIPVAAGEAGAMWRLEVAKEQVASLAAGTADLLMVCRYELG